VRRLLACRADRCLCAVYPHVDQSIRRIRYALFGRMAVEIKSPLAQKVWACYTHESFEWSVREIMAMTGLSYANAYVGLIVLQDKGLVERTQNEDQRFIYRRTS
jgi:DNA-binding transcriptional ArsR family regulator